MREEFERLRHDYYEHLRYGHGEADAMRLERRLLALERREDWTVKRLVRTVRKLLGGKR